MSKDITKLRKENDELKSQVAGFGKELEQIQSQLANIDADKDIERSVQYLSDDYDSFKSFKERMETEVLNMASRLSALEDSVYKIDEAIEDALNYSYQYNIKIVGIKQNNRYEPAKDTVEFCLKLFNELGANVAEYDIDIAHRVPSRNSNFPPPIICKFTRRMAKESVMSQRNEITKIDLDNIGAETALNGKIGIYDHLTPRTQKLFAKAKEFQKEHNYSFCWTKNSSVLLKASSESKVIRVTSIDVLSNLECGTDPTLQPEFHQTAAMSYPPTQSTRGRPRTRNQNR